MAGSKVTKTIFQYAYGIGASIVIVGALAKILHVDILGMSGSFLLAVGMGTEAVIFFMSAFEPQEEDLDSLMSEPRSVSARKKLRPMRPKPLIPTRIAHGAL